MLRIKLVRTGKRNAPVFRVAVGEGLRVNEYLGTYNPQMTPPLVQIDKDKVKEWVGKGAQLTPAVDQLLKGKYEFQPYVPKKTGAEEEEAGAESPPPAEPEQKETPAEETPAEEAPAEKEDKPVEEPKKEKSEEKPAEEPQKSDK